MTTPVVLITGALTGIGRATALAFAQEGAHLVVSGRREEEGEKLVAELRKLGAEAEFVRSDVHHEAEIRSLVDQTFATFCSTVLLPIHPLIQRRLHPAALRSSCQPPPTV